MSRGYPLRGAHQRPMTLNDTATVHGRDPAGQRAREPARAGGTADSERDPSQSTDWAQSPTDAAVDRLDGLLPPEALEDALKGLEPEEIIAAV